MFPNKKRISGEFIGLGILLAINLISIFGFVVFTLNPQSLVRWPWAIPIYTVSYPVFAQLQIYTAFLAMVFALNKYCGFRWILSFVLIVCLSAGSELLGTTSGIPFGPYSYTNLLGPKLFGHVPYLIPLSWFFMALPSFWLAYHAMSGSSWASSFGRIVLASILLLAWDLTLDPAMSYLTPFWLWSKAGYYYGMPFSNLVGWFVTGLVLMVVLEFTRSIEWLNQIPGKFLVGFYLANLALPFFMSVFAGLGAAILTTAIVAVLYVTLLLVQRSKNRNSLNILLSREA